MLMRTDPFRDLDRLTNAILGTSARPATIPMDAYRQDDTFVVHLDLPGVDPDAIDVTIEENVLSIRAHRSSPAEEEIERVVDERDYGTLSRQLFLGDSLETENLTADYEAGVMTITIPIVEGSKPRKIQITDSGERSQIRAA